MRQVVFASNFMQASESLYSACASAQAHCTPGVNSDAGLLTLSFARLMTVDRRARHGGSLGTSGSW